MDQIEELETKIEQMRSKMYDASASTLNRGQVVELSKEVDEMIEELEDLKHTAQAN